VDFRNLSLALNSSATYTSQSSQAKLLAGSSPTLISYVSALFPPREATLLRGFALSLCENSWIAGAASRVPSLIIDLAEGQEVLLPRRDFFFPRQPFCVKLGPRRKQIKNEEK
jgi:hypothetical protein